MIPTGFPDSSETTGRRPTPSGETFESTFHEGFFQGALETRFVRRVNVRQETNYEGEAGTRCRHPAVDVAE